jgi:pantoate--beta-alanine ligase
LRKKEKSIQEIETIDQMHSEVSQWLRQGKAVAFVPTMGYLHEGHLALMEEGRKQGDVLVASIFVNPTQFGPGEDFQAYPRDLDRDLRLAESVGVDVVFTPKGEEMYGKAYQTYIDLDALPRFLCGPSRPGHFRGVVTVVSKLFNIVRPQVAIFGEKDYQQLVIIRQMVRDLNFDVRIISVPTVREPDGLAMSSRNAYLSEEERIAAVSLFKALQKSQENVVQGMRNAGELIEAASGVIDSHRHTKIDYVALCDPETLEAVAEIEEPTLMALAVWVGRTRLIDNTILTC